MSTRAALPQPQTWAEPRLPPTAATSRSRHALPRQSSCDRRVPGSFPTFVLFWGQRRGRPAAERSCRGGGGGGRQLFPVAVGARARCRGEVCEEETAVGGSRRACGGAPRETERGASGEQRGRREREEVSLFVPLSRSVGAFFCLFFSSTTVPVCARRSITHNLVFLESHLSCQEVAGWTCQRLILPCFFFPPSLFWKQTCSLHQNSPHCAQGRCLHNGLICQGTRSTCVLARASLHVCYYIFFSPPHPLFYFSFVVIFVVSHAASVRSSSDPWLECEKREHDQCDHVEMFGWRAAAEW